MSEVASDRRPLSERLVHRRRSGVKLFASPRDEPRSRRAADVTSLAMAVVATIALGVVAEPPSTFERSWIQVAQATPTFLDVLWSSSKGLLALWSVGLVVAALVRRRWTIARDTLLAALVGLGYAVVAFRMVAGSWPTSVDVFHFSSDDVQLPALGLAWSAAAVLAAAPHVSRPFRRWGRWLQACATVSFVLVGATTPAGALMALSVAAAAAATTHLVFGSSAGRPGLTEVAEALSELGVDAGDLHVADRQDAGVFTVAAIGQSGDLTVKVYGRDARDTQLLARAWRALWYRRAEGVTLTRLQQVEHEAFMTLLAKNGGVAVPEIVTAGRTARGDALLVLRDEGVSFAEVPGATVTDDVIASVWDELDLLHLADIAHGNLGPSALAYSEVRGVLITNLSGATVAPAEDQRQADRAQVLVTCAVLVGVQRATDVALARLGVDAVVTMLPYLQAAALGPDLRRSTKAAGVDVDALRKQAAEAAGATSPEMAKLRRVTGRSLVMATIFAVAAYALLSALGGVDFAELWNLLQDASWWWIAAGMVLAQAPRLGQAIGTRGASPVSLPYGPVVALQFAVTFIGLAVPTAAGRIGIEIRFFQRHGQPPAAAVSVGAIDSFGGFLVQLIILGTALLFGGGTMFSELTLDSTSVGGKLLWAVLVAFVAVLLAAVVFVVVPRLRRWLWARVHPWISQILDTLRGVRSPARFLQILAGNVIAEILFASTLAVFLQAFGVTVGLGTLLVINVLVSLFAGIMPVPGGIGVSAGALITLLIAAGVDETVAFGAVALYRIATFYIATLIGALAFRWLERNRYI